MFGFLSQIVFMQPIVLAAMAGLPVLWYLLRITPPAPKTIFFPAARFLKDLVSEEQTPSHTPWWLLLLRLLIAALIIVALAKPVINPASSLEGQGHIRIILDNSWASAQNWETLMNTAEELVTQASREGRELYILPTSPALGKDKITQHGPLVYGQAMSILRGMAPNPWPADYENMKEAISAKHVQGGLPIHSIWLSHGLDEGGIRDVLGSIQNHGDLRFYMPQAKDMPLLLRPTTQALTREELRRGDSIRIDVDAPRDIADGLPVSVQALSSDGDVLDARAITLTPDSLPQTVVFDILDDLKSKAARFRIAGRSGAGALFLLDDDFKKRNIGIIGSAQFESGAPLIDDIYYIKRALEPFAVIHFGEVAELIDKGLPIIIMPDTGAMPAQTLNTLEQWVQDGGLLLRFSGPHLADVNNAPFLLPVTIRSGGRSLSGSLSWEKPQRIAPFDEGSPFYGLEVPSDVNVRQQVLATPEQDLSEKVWARLSDGTPFITASREDQGLIVLIHTTANTDWSNFALSGLYVSVLRRIIRLAGQDSVNVDLDFESLDPLLVMDGYGNLVSPSGAVRPVTAQDLKDFVPTPFTPPGLYGNAQTQFALNLGASEGLAALRPVSLPSSITRNYYTQGYETNLSPFFLYAAACLFCIDWLIMVFMVGAGTRLLHLLPRKRSAHIIIIFATFCIISPSGANEDRDVRYASGFYLAYIRTGDSQLDALTHKGLESLSKALTQRTSVEPAGVAGLDPEHDTLAFFPIIFWPISPRQPAYSDTALENIQFYLDHGGTIVFDTRDKNRSTLSMINTENAKALRRVSASLDIPPLVPIAEDHVLSRAFYLLDNYPGRYSEGTLWMERHSATGRDNVSSVIITSNDWIGAWADSYDEQNTNLYMGRVTPPSRRQREMSLRVGINVIMYALTGNYKADQVHIPHILQRLGR
ncbi:MAG: DUF4159 domain-containing protein [Alphaproteobacteria bacterium]